jgi:hypothetical protein
MVEPRTQWFGNGFGQKGSTSKIGAWAAAVRVCAAAPGWGNQWSHAAPKTTSTIKQALAVLGFIAASANLVS